MKGASVPRLVAALTALVLALGVLAAAPPLLLINPSAIVFPFTATGDLQKDAGTRIALVIANRIAELHDVRIKSAPPGVTRANYLEAARHEGADYYVAGYLTPLGTEVAVVAQVVSTQTGIVIYSGTTQLTTYAEAVGQGDSINTAIVRHAMRDLGSYATPPNIAANSAVPTAPPTGGPKTQTDIGRLVRGRRGRATPTPRPGSTPNPAGGTIVSPNSASGPIPPVPTPLATPRPQVTPPPVSLPPVPPNTTRPVSAAATPAAVAAAPSAAPARVLALEDVGGSAEGERRTIADQALRSEFQKRGVTVVALAGSPSETCSTTHASGIAGGGLSVRSGDPAFNTAIATLELTVKNCDGSVAYDHSFERDAGGPNSVRISIERAADAAVGAYMNPPKPRRRR